jgi:hypothetical protein
MEPERRRSERLEVDGKGSNGVVRGSILATLHDISSGGLGLRLPSSLDPGGVYPFTALLRGLSLTTPIRVTRCRALEAYGAGAGKPGLEWEVGAEFLWRDDGDAAALRRWVERCCPARLTSTQS